jgi:hypothetical protein
VIRVSYTPLIAGLFGHRRPDDPLPVRWLDAATQWAGDHWTILAVIIPVTGLIVAGVINHYLALARDARARRLGQGDVRARVHADLAARLLAHCSYIQTTVGDPAGHANDWRPGNASLRARAEQPDVIEVLGKQYVSFMAAIEKERRAIETTARDGQPRKHFARAACDVVETYTPFICDFGEPVQGRRLAAIAREASAHV